MIELELLKGVDRVYAGRLAVLPLVKQTLRNLGVSRKGGHLIVSFHPAEEPSEILVPPLRIEMDPGYDYAVVRIARDGTVQYERKFTMTELLGEQLAAIVGPLDPRVQDWTARMAAEWDGSVSYGGRSAPEVEGVIEIDPGRPRALPFEVTRTPAPDTARVDPAQFGIELGDPGKDEDGEAERTPPGVLLPSALHTLLTRDMHLSDSIEEGGFLLGRPRRVAGPGERYLIEITHVTPAERSGAGALHFTFTPDSFTAVHREIVRRGNNEELVGWYHTHLFSAGALSATDDRLHLNTFGQPWQVAGLINLDLRGRRRLRFFGRAGDREMGRCAVWTDDERGRYRPADAVVDEL